jgi:16S rRNA (guanine527-N7)-methyltransferase
MMPIPDETIIRCLGSYGVVPDTSQCGQIRTYVSTLLKWNRSIALTSITDELEVIKFHFGESVFALFAIQGQNSRLADVGSGAGFPGLALKIFSDSLDLVLIESNARKCAFLLEVSRSLGLSGVRVLRSRFEEAGEFRASLNFIASRALGGYSELLDWSKESLVDGGKLILWVGGENARLVANNSDWLWQPPVAIPGSKRRFVLVGTSMQRASE